MRILLAAPHMPPRFVGGVEVLVQRLAQSLAAMGHDVDAVSIDQVTHGGADTSVAVATDNAEGVRHTRLHLAMKSFQSQYAAPVLADWMRGYLRQRRPDVVHLQSGYLLGGAVLAAAEAERVPRVVTLYDYWFICSRTTLRHPDGRICDGPSPPKCAWCIGADRAPLRRLDRLTRGGVTAAISVALRVPRADRLVGWWPRVEEVAARQGSLAGQLARAQVVMTPARFVATTVQRWTARPAGILVDRTGHGDGAMAPRPAGPSPGRVRVTYLGQIAPHKGVHVLVDAVRASGTKGLVLRIGGPLDPAPDYVKRLRALAGDDPRIAFLGSVPRSGIATLLASTDVLVVPSLWHEVYPLVILEARAHGVPVVAARVGGLPELVDDGVDGVLVPPGDVAALARVLQRFVDDPAALAALASNVRPPRSVADEHARLVEVYEAAVRVGPDGVLPVESVGDVVR